MAVVRLKGLNRVKKKLKDGREAVYWYAWKGGPKLEGNPGSPEFVAGYNRAVADRRAPKRDDLAALVARYRGSPEYLRLSTSTKGKWSIWLDRIASDAQQLDIGALPLTALDDRRARADILEWRDQWADRPRSADYAMQVVSRVLSWGMDRGLLAINIAAGISQLYESDRSDQIWTQDDLALYAMAAPSPEVGFVPHLACLTGLRRADLCKLTDAHVGEVAIVIPTGKSRGRKHQVIPLLEDTKALLAEIRAQRDRRHAELVALALRKGRPAPPKTTAILSNTRGRAWTADGIETQLITTKNDVGVDKHLHDGRGTFATRLRVDGRLTGPEIADILGWDEDRVERILSVYVDRAAIVLSIAQRMQRRD